METRGAPALLPPSSVLVLVLVRPPAPPRVLQTCHDEAARFVQLLKRPGSDGLVQEDFVPFLQVRGRRGRGRGCVRAHVRTRVCALCACL